MVHICQQRTGKLEHRVTTSQGARDNLLYLIIY